MNDRHDDPLDHSIRSALHDIVSESPNPGDLPVRSLELRRAGAVARSRRAMLVAAAIIAVAGVAGTVALASRATPSNTVKLKPEAAAEELREAAALLESVTTVVETTIDGAAGQPVDTTGPDPITRDTASLPGIDPRTTVVPTDSTPVTSRPGNLSIFDISVPRQVQAGDVVVFEWSASDPNGIEQTNARVGGASGYVTWCPFPIAARRISGDEELGRYTAQCTVPANAPNGEYTVFFQASGRTGAPSGIDWQGTFEVVNGSSDTAPPAISEVSVPQSASVGDSITITWRAVDPSGVDYSIAWFSNGGFALSDGTRVVDYGDLGVKRISGNEFDGVYSQTIRFTDRSPLGTYSIWLSRRDGVGNKSIDPVSAAVVLTA